VSDPLSVIADPKLEPKQKRAALASLAEEALPYPEIGKKAKELFAAGILCDLNEGHAPYRPRYILPDYAILFARGSDYLDLAPPRDFYEAVNALLIAYEHVPSITGYPVYLGDVDRLLEPFVPTVSEAERRNLLKLFLTQVDRCLPDAFVHMDLGPEETVVGRDIIEISALQKRAVPNISLRFSSATPQGFAELAASAALEVGKPYFVNHEALSADVGSDYAVASCYNTLRRGGGSLTLVRLSLKKLAERSTGAAAFLERDLPEAMAALTQVINARARFVVEQSHFFEASFLAREGLVSLDKFTSMAGVFGLYEAVEKLSGGARLGESEEANELGIAITAKARELVKSVSGVYCAGYGGRISFHAQSGIDSDVDTTPGVRIRYGRELGLAKQLPLEGKLHSFFDSGVSEIAVFDRTAASNPAGLVRIARGAMQSGIRVFSIIGADSDMIRVTGYLVKRSDIEKYRAGVNMREGTVALGAESLVGGRVLERKAVSVE
jgi:YjjI family glycine radical enzyme